MVDKAKIDRIQKAANKAFENMDNIFTVIDAQFTHLNKEFSDEEKRKINIEASKEASWKNQQVEEAKEEFEKSMRRMCLSCGKMVPISSVYCRRCGHTLIFSKSSKLGMFELVFLTLALALGCFFVLSSKMVLVFIGSVNIILVLLRLNQWFLEHLRLEKRIKSFESKYSYVDGKPMSRVLHG